MAGPQPRATAAPATDTPPSLAGPLDLSGIERTGAVRFGHPVARVVVVFRDGRRASLDLPEPVSIASGLSFTQQEIMRVVRDSPTALPRKAVAKALGRETTKGSFGAAVRDLLESWKLLYQHGDEITDDPSKFGPPGP